MQSRGAGGVVRDNWLMKYFHIDSVYLPANKQLLEEGDTIRTADRFCNPYYEQICDINHELPVSLGGPPINWRLRQFFSSNVVAKVPSGQLAGITEKILRSYIRLLREMEFENVRRTHFEHLPSRTRCIWLSDSVDRAKDWQRTLGKSATTRIVSVEIDGRLHRADGGHLPDESTSIAELRAAAELYWRGLPHPKGECEYLLEGTMKVLGIVG